MIALQMVEKVNSALKEARQIAKQELPKVEVVIDGKVVGLASENLARSVAMAIKFKKLQDEVENQLSRCKNEIKLLLKDENLTQRPIRLRIQKVGEVTVSKKEPTVSILDPRGVYKILKDKFFEVVSFKAKKDLVKIACDADSKKGEKLREYLAVKIEDDDTVKVTAKKQ